MRIAALTICLFVLTAIPIFNTGSGNARSARSTVGSIQLTAKNLLVTTRRMGPPGRISDATEQVWSLRNRFGHEIGRWLLTCRWVNAAARLCTTVVRMPLGQITATGSSPTPYIGTYAVVGGTGIYDGAGGFADFTTIGRGKLILSITLT
jgi:hypothetical protein